MIPSPKRGSDKISMPKQGRDTQKNASCIAQSRLTWIPALSEVDFEPSANVETNRTRALVGFY